MKTVAVLLGLLAVAAFVVADEEPPTVDAPKVDTPGPETKSAETFAFQADVSKIMDIIIHSLYSNKEIFLRELISNASDALDKIRFFALTDSDKYGAMSDLDMKIRVVPNKEANTLTIIDTGVGMTRDQLSSELGTVARSGTSSFIEAFEQNADVSLIGQFGVGFYSVYLVADTVTVTSKHPDSEIAYTWESSADQTFTIAEAPEYTERGTQITLHLKEDSAQYLDAAKVKDILRRHSQFINYPIYLEVEKEIEVTDEEEEDDEDDQGEGDEDEIEVDDEDEDEDEDEEGQKKTKTETVVEDELVNDSKPLWLRPPSDIEEEEYEEFYKVLSKGQETPQTYIHFNAEGEVEFRSILYVPKTAPMDAYQDYSKSKGTISLYVRRVLITDEFDELLPNYLGFVRGVVDSDSLPLNVNREMLQQSKVLKVIGKKLTRKAIAMLQSLATKHLNDEEDEEDEEDEGEEDDGEDVEEEEGEEEETPEDNEDYLNLFNQFGKFIKLGVTEDRSNQARLAKLLRFPSTHKPDGVTSLEAYIERMKDDQKAIFYIAGDNIEALQNHPTIEKLTAKGYEVFLLTDPLDEHCLQGLGEFQSHKISDTSRATLKLDETKEEKKRIKAVEELYKPLTKWYKDTLGSEVEKVVVSKRLETSACAVVAGDYGWTASMERVMTSQVFTNVDSMGYMKARKTFEVNPAHPIVKSILSQVNALEAEGDDEEEENDAKEDSAETKALKDSAILLYQTCLLNSGFSLPATSSAEFSNRLDRLIRAGLDVSVDAKVEQPEVEIPETEVEEEAPEDDDDDDLEELDLDGLVGGDVDVEAEGAEPAAEHLHEEL